MTSRSTQRPVDLDAAGGLTVAEAVRSTAKSFLASKLTYGHGTTSAREEAAWLVLHACQLPLDSLAISAKRTLTTAQIRKIDHLVGRRINEKIPAAYLTGEAWLGDFRFFVDRRVIVPRSFIAELLPDGVDLFLGRRVSKALDLCTGSGCLAILLAHAFPKTRVDAVDLSSAALAVAKRNIVDYGLAGRIDAIRSNLFEALEGRRYDLIVSNPPYVRSSSMKTLPDEYLKEPRMSLAGGQDGLVLVRRILAEARQHLTPRGGLVCEIGHNRKALERAFPRVPFTWLETSAGPDFVFFLGKEDLPS